MAVYTFLESYDRTGKTLIPFSTSASGGFGRSLEGLAASATGAEILDGGPALHQRHPALGAAQLSKGVNGIVILLHDQPCL